MACCCTFTNTVDQQFTSKPWWQLQGVVQYTLNPGAGATADRNPADRTRIPNSWVVGFHTGITF